MVHHEKRYDSINIAALEKNGVAVLGILFHVSEKPNPMVENVLQNAGTVFEAVGKNQTYLDKLLLQDLLPKVKSSFFRYEGSLTTPGCGEAVVWTVFENSISISIDQVCTQTQVSYEHSLIIVRLGGKIQGSSGWGGTKIDTQLPTHPAIEQSCFGVRPGLHGWICNQEHFIYPRNSFDNRRTQRIQISISLHIVTLSAIIVLVLAFNSSQILAFRCLIMLIRKFERLKVAANHTKITSHIVWS